MSLQRMPRNLPARFAFTPFAAPPRLCHVRCRCLTMISAYTQRFGHLYLVLIHPGRDSRERKKKTLSRVRISYHRIPASPRASPIKADRFLTPSNVIVNRYMRVSPRLNAFLHQRFTYTGQPLIHPHIPMLKLQWGGSVKLASPLSRVSIFTCRAGGPSLKYPRQLPITYHKILRRSKNHNDIKD